MRVLYFHQYFSTPEGAAGTRSYELARRLIERGHSVLMVCARAERGDTGVNGPYINGRRRGTVDGIEVLEFNLAYANRDSLLRRTVLFLAFAIQSVWVALREPCDLIVATSTPLTAGIPGVFARWVRQKPFVFEVRDLWPELPRAMRVIRNPVVLWAMSLLEWVNYHSASRLIGLAPGIVEGIARQGVDPARIALIPNGCDHRIFAGVKETWRPAGVHEGQMVAVFAGAHGMANGLVSVLDAAAELRRRGNSQVTIVLVGEGKLKAQLEERARKSELTNVVFVEPVDKARLAGLFASSNIGLQILANVPAFYDGTSPNKFFDYLSAGLPVLVNYPGWLTELVQDYDCGFVVPPNDPEAFADALEQAAADPATLLAMGSRAAALGRDHFDRLKLGEEFVSWLEGAVEL